VTLLIGSYEPRFIEKYLVGRHPLGSVYNEGVVSPSSGLERHSIVSELFKTILSYSECVTDDLQVTFLRETKTCHLFRGLPVGTHHGRFGSA